MKYIWNNLYLNCDAEKIKVKNDHRSKFSNLSNWIEEAWKNQGFDWIRTRDFCEIPVQCSTNWAMKPHTGNEVY